MKAKNKDKKQPYNNKTSQHLLPHHAKVCLRCFAFMHGLNVTSRTKQNPSFHNKLRQDRPYPRDWQLNLYYLRAGKGLG